MCRVRSDPETERNGGLYLELGRQVTGSLQYDAELDLIRRSGTTLAGWLSYVIA